ncbi:MAG: PadR family transcriptional regulator [Anaerolineales bacterium]|jgi:PadR family transcriptional regulator PadR
MPGKSLARELKRGTLEMILLKLLSQQPMYGYELIAALENRGGEPFQLKEGTLYPVLYRLEDAGLVEARWETRERGSPRKYYHLTEAGGRELQTLVGEWQIFSGAVNHLLEMENR